MVWLPARIPGLPSIYTIFSIPPVVEFIDPNSLDHHSEATINLIEKIEDFLKGRDINEILAETKKNLEELWEKLKSGLHSEWSINEVDGNLYLRIIFHGHRAWIKFKTQEIFHELRENKELMNGDERFIQTTLTTKKIHPNDIALLLCASNLYKADFGALEKQLEDILRFSTYDTSLQKEALLLRCFSNYILAKDITNSIEIIIKLSNDHEDDPRIFRLLGRLYESQGKGSESTTDLRYSLNYAKQAYELVERNSEFKVECFNNYAYVLALSYRNKLEGVSINDLQNALNELEKSSGSVNWTTGFPIEIWHTLGLLGYLFAKNNPNLTKEARISLWQIALENLEKAYAQYPNDEEYKPDYYEAERELKKLKKVHSK